METVGRFAPTPSGRMHLGNLFCFLLAWLSARAEGGRVILRIEDLDPDRSKSCWLDKVEDDLRFLGLDWDEGGGTEGPHSPYYQSQRTFLYEKALDKLADLGMVYPCFCSRSQLHIAEAPHASDGEVIYTGACRSLSSEEIENRSKLRAPALRLQVPDETIGFTDGHYGRIEQNLQKECGDFIVRRMDRVFAYQLAVVVDDNAMGVTQVVRGRDLLSSTPRQIYLYRLFGWEPPAFIHLPLLLAPDGRRLSKRDVDLDLDVLRSRGWTGEKLTGYLAYTAGLLKRPEPVSPRELVSDFSWDKIPREDLRLPPGML